MNLTDLRTRQGKYVAFTNGGGVGISHPIDKDTIECQCGIKPINAHSLGVVRK